MRILYLLAIIYIGFTLSSCATDTTTKNIHHPAQSTTPAKKDPLNVAFYTKEKPKTPYKVIGQERISKYNLGGNKRQEAHIRDGMRELAAAMGGDAVIDIQHDSKSITGTVVAFQAPTEISKG